MNKSPISISNEEAKRIKEVVAEEYIKLRESLSSCDKKENSNLRRKFSPRSPVIQEKRIREITTEVVAKLPESIACVEPRRRLSNFASGAQRSDDVNVKRRPDMCKYISCSEKNEKEKRSPKTKVSFQNNNRSRYRILRSPSCLARKSASNSEVDSLIDFSVNNLINGQSNRTARTSSPLSRKKSGNQPERDFSPIIIDCSIPCSSIGVDLSSPNFSEHIPNSPTKIDRSNSVEVFVDTEISIDRGESADLQNEISASQTIDTNSWENFVVHLVAVQKNDNLWELFTHEDITIFNEFTGLCMPAQTIFIHLLNSEFIWYRISSFINSVITQELKPFIDTLIEKQFLITDTNNEEIRLLIELLSLQELRKLCTILGLRCDGNRRILLESLVKFSESYLIENEGKRQDYKNFIKQEILKISGKVIKLNRMHRELFLRTQLVYALPLAKTMKPDGRIQLITIMNDVSTGKITYPDYSLEPLQKLFLSRESLERFQNALLLEANIKWKMESKDFDEVVSLHEAAIVQFQEELRDGYASEQIRQLPDYLRAFTRGTVLAHAIHHSIECLRAKKMYTKMISAYEILLSQDLYLKSYKGIWYDQLAQIYQQIMRDISKTVIFLTEALVDPSLNFIDRVLLSNRAFPIVNIRKKRRAEAQMYEELKSLLCILKGVREIPINAGYFDGTTEKEKKFSYVYETEEGVGQILSTPEEVIMLHFKQCGYGHGVHAPCGVGSSVFGVLFWDIIYNTKVPNVFLCPYQSLPLDLTSGEFYSNRERQIKARLVQIKELWNDQEMNDHVLKIWSREEGKKSIVSWKTFEDSKQFQVILKCIGRKLLAKICEKMAKDFYLLQKGFPSMILWNQTNKTCKFIQVKEPNSQLTPSQTSWLLHLSTAGGDAFACFVNGVGSKTQKRKLDITSTTLALEDSLVLDMF